jgi:hypothetical protein
MCSFCPFIPVFHAIIVFTRRTNTRLEQLSLQQPSQAITMPSNAQIGSTVPQRTVSLRSQQRKPLPEYNLDLLKPPSPSSLSNIRFKTRKDWTEYVRATGATGKKPNVIAFVQNESGEYFTGEARDPFLDTLKAACKEIYYRGYISSKTTWSYVDAEARNYVYCTGLAAHPFLGLCDDGIWKVKEVLTQKFTTFMRNSDKWTHWSKLFSFRFSQKYS